MQETKKVVKKAKLLTSNFTLQEQIEAIEKTFYSLGSVSQSALKFNKTDFKGITVNDVSFFEEGSSTESMIDKGNFLASFSSSLLLELFKLMEIDSDNRIINISEENGILKLSDFLMDKDHLLNIEYTKYSEFDFNFDTRIFYYFKLNNKTINKNTNLYLFEKCLIISSIRKKKEILFLWKFLD